MTDNVVLQAQLDAANQRIRELETAIHLDAVQCSVNTSDMPHEPCDKIQELSEDVKALHKESHGTSVIVGRINLLAGIIGAVALPTFGFLGWLALQVWHHDVRIVEIEFGLREVAQQVRTAQPSTVAKSP